VNDFNSGCYANISLRMEEGFVMILYHFTDMYALKHAGPNNDDIPEGKKSTSWTWTDDLKPGPDSMKDWDYLGITLQPGVWFTTIPNHRPIYGLIVILSISVLP
jgi:hypothetical protein